MLVNNFRCNCPITSVLDLIGDKWSIVIIKQILMEEKRTFKDFTEGYEAIASNILSSRLKMLESINLIKKNKLPNNKKTNIYTLTEKGINLTPVIIEIILWSVENIRDLHPSLNFDERLDMIKEDKEKFITMTIDNYRRTLPVFE